MVQEIILKHEKVRKNSEKVKIWINRIEYSNELLKSYQMIEPNFFQNIFKAKVLKMGEKKKT